MKDANTRSILDENWKTNRTTSFLVIALGYLVALIIGLIIYNAIDQTIWLKLLWADLAATLVIWICSLFLDNASVYDPYWSVQPIIILPLLILQEGSSNLLSLLLFALILIWGLRLTSNWAVTFNGLHQQDWRYDMIKNKTGSLYPIVNLLGIQLMPTLVVFACILPAVFLILNTPELTFWAVPGLLISLLGLVLEAIADRQMRDFRQKNPGRSAINRTGLWKHSRHPNYLGEILMWWGVFLACLGAAPSAWVFGLGACLNTALFLFISIPMAEKRLAEYKDGFEEYKRETRELLPLPK